MCFGVQSRECYWRAEGGADHGAGERRRRGGVMWLRVEEKKKEKEAKTATARTLWMPAVNNHGGFGRWAFLEITDPYDDVVELIRSISNQGSLSD